MTKVRPLTFLLVGAILISTAVPVLAQTTVKGKGLGTATTTGSQAPAAPGQAAPTNSKFTPTPGQGTTSATSTPANSSPGASNIGRGTAK